MYKLVDISAETWNKAEVSVISIHENYVNKTVLLLLCIYDVFSYDGVVKILMT